MKELHKINCNSAPYTSFIFTNWHLANYPVITTTLRFSPSLSFLPQINVFAVISNRVHFLYILDQRQFPAIHRTHLDLLCQKGACVNTVGDTISMQVEPWFSAEAGKDFLKRENGGEMYYHDMGKSVKIQVNRN